MERATEKGREKTKTSECLVRADMGEGETESVSEQREVGG